MLTGVVGVGLIAGLVTATVMNHGKPRHSVAARAKPVRRVTQQSAAVVAAVTLSRAQAVTWIAQQVSPGAIVACDPDTCSALEAAGLSSGRLFVLQPTTPDPLGSDLVVATPAVRGQFGARLASVYAPLVIASFGTGATDTEIRVVATNGPSSFQASLAADLTARISAGRKLLKHVRASTAARADISAGSVDSRLLAVLTALAARQRLSIAAFGDPSPGAPDIPLRGAEIGKAPLAQLRPMLAFLHGERGLYQPAQARIVRVAKGQYLLTVQYAVAPGR